MPNWVYNTLDVAGPGADAFKQVVETAIGEGTGFIPHLIPAAPWAEEDAVKNKDGGVMFYALSDERYDWCLENWGVKWGDCGTTLRDDSPDVATVRFDTPWGPPGEGIRNISALYPKATFTLMSIEEQPAFRARIVCRRGETVSTEEDSFFTAGCPIGEMEGLGWGEAYWNAVMNNLHRTVFVATANEREWELTVGAAHRLALCGDEAYV